MRKKVALDVVLNLFASAIPLVALQFFAVPFAARNMTAIVNGEMVSVYSLMVLFGSSLGSVLNNSRLIRHRSYLSQGLSGDFNFILVFACVISALATALGALIIVPNIKLFDAMTMAFTAILFVITTYLMADFRIKLDYKSILIDSIIRSIGFIIGLYFFYISGYWSLIYLTGYMFSLLYQYNKTTFLKEPFQRTQLFKPTLLQYLMLLSGGILISSSVYIDKLLLFPLLGGEAVSIYYAATITGKTIGMIVGPMTGVMLSYFSQMDSFDNVMFNKLLKLLFVFGFLGYFIVLVLSKPLLMLLYPQYVDQAIGLIPLTTATTIFLMICNVINAVLLKFHASKWQFIINGSYLLIYLVFSLILLKLFGIIGFCVGLLIAAIFKFILMISVYNNPQTNLKEQF